MALRDDLKQAYEDYGSEIVIIRDSGDVSGEFVSVEINAQVTKPFIREFHREADFQYDTEAVTADIVKTVTDNDHFMVMNLTDEVMQGDAVSKSGVVYKCNVSGEVTRFSGERDATSYHYGGTWENVKSDAYALLAQGLFGTDLEQDEDIGQIETQNMRIWLPDSYGVQQLDRYTPHSGEHYKIEAIEKYRFPGIIVCQVSEDTRE